MPAGSPAFKVRVEDLADQGFEAALEPGFFEVFDQWRASLTDEAALDSPSEPPLQTTQTH